MRAPDEADVYCEPCGVYHQPPACNAGLHTRSALDVAVVESLAAEVRDLVTRVRVLEDREALREAVAEIICGGVPAVGRSRHLRSVRPGQPV
jgi:hypothetical protein